MQLINANAAYLQPYCNQHVGHEILSMRTINSLSNRIYQRNISRAKNSIFYGKICCVHRLLTNRPPPQKKEKKKKITVCPKLFIHSNRNVLHELMIQKVIIFLSQNHLDKHYLNISYLVPSQDLAHQNMTMRMLEF